MLKAEPLAALAETKLELQSTKLELRYLEKVVKQQDALIENLRQQIHRQCVDFRELGDAYSQLKENRVPKNSILEK